MQVTLAELMNSIEYKPESLWLLALQNKPDDPAIDVYASVHYIGKSNYGTPFAVIEFPDGDLDVIYVGNETIFETEKPEEY